MMTAAWPGGAHPVFPSVDEGPTSNTNAEYHEWPMRSFFKLITIGEELRYSMEFSLEEVQQLCAVACPLHISSVDSNSHFSTRPAGSCSAVTRAEKTRTPPPSQSKRHPFTRDEDAKLIVYNRLDVRSHYAIAAIFHQMLHLHWHYPAVTIETFPMIQLYLAWSNLSSEILRFERERAFHAGDEKWTPSLDLHVLQKKITRTPRHRKRIIVRIEDRPTCFVKRIPKKRQITIRLHDSSEVSDSE